MGKHAKGVIVNKNSWIKEIAIFVIIASIATVVIRGFLIQPFYIPSSSMEDTLEINDTILVSKLTPNLFDIQRGDIVVFKDPDKWVMNPQSKKSTSIINSIFSKLNLSLDNNETYLVKRVIGLPGDTVECKGKGQPILVNGKEIYEPYLKEIDSASDFAFKVKVPKGRIWVMGDNRNNSADSRFHMNEEYHGTVPIDKVVGKAKVIIWPISRISFISNDLQYGDK